jgi:hypothetical protein
VVEDRGELAGHAAHLLLAQLEAREARDVEHLLAVDHPQSMIGEAPAPGGQPRSGGAGRAGGGAYALSGAPVRSSAIDRQPPATITAIATSPR